MLLKYFKNPTSAPAIALTGLAMVIVEPATGMSATMRKFMSEPAAIVNDCGLVEVVVV